MVKRKRSWGLFWPTVAAGVIATLLLLHPHRPRSASRTKRELDRSIAETPFGSTQPLRMPRPLGIAPPDHAAIGELAAAIADSAVSRQSGSDTRHKETVEQTASVLQSSPMKTQLHAPLLPPQDELAGLPSGEPVASAAAFVTRSTASPLTTATVRTQPSLARQQVGDLSTAWPPTPALDHLLEQAASIVEARDWIAQVNTSLQRLRQRPTVSDRAAGGILKQLQQLAQQGLKAAEQQRDRAQQKLWLRTAHAVNRRVAAWLPIWETTQRSPMQLASADLAVDLAGVQPLVRQAALACQSTGDEAAWQEFLLLRHLTDGRLAEDPARRQIVAQRFLSRLDWEGLSTEQSDWLQTAKIQRLAAAIRPWAAGPVDYTQLMHQLERQESDALDLGSIDVATAAQTLRFAGGSRPRQVATAINAHYRNANLRMSVSDDLLMRLLPDVPDQSGPVREMILGTRVAGTSHVSSDLQLRLRPDPTSWSLDLLATGNVSTATRGRQGPVSVRNSNQAQFAAATPITIRPQSIQMGEAEIDVHHATRLRGMQTDFDRIPLLGSLVRSIAMAQYRDQFPQVRRITTARLQRRIATQMEGEIEQQIDEATDRLSERLLGPLAKMRLSPTVVDLQTDEHRLTARYRLAGDWQLAAFTPRPRAPGDSALSIQLHQSALNNSFERFLPSSQSRSIRELASELFAMFGRAADAVPADIPHDIHIQFAPTRPITVEIDDDQLWLTLRIVRLHGEAGLDLRHFIVRATYHPQAERMQASFVRDGHLSISGRRMSFGDRVAVRAIFNKVLSESRPLPLLSSQLADHPAAAGLQVSQFELRDGWIGLAIGPAKARGVAGRSTPFASIVPTPPAARQFALVR